MTDLLDQIAAQQEAIVQRWRESILALPASPYRAVGNDELLASIRRSSQALLDVMRSGQTAAVEAMIRDSARRRRADGVNFSDSAAVWLLYRQAVHETLTGTLKSVDAWEEMIDRVDAVLNWVIRILNAVYKEG